MAFEALSEKFQKLFQKLKGESKLSEKNVEDILSEIRIALLDADTNNDVIKDFLNTCKEKMLGEAVNVHLNPSQVVVKIVNDEIIKLLGSETYELNFSKQGPTNIMLVGLQGSGKTTMASKLANYLKNKKERRVMLAGIDIYRPGAMDQLEALGKQCGVFTYLDRSCKDAVKIASDAYNYAKYNNYDTVIYDTAGRLSIDSEMMDELVRLKSKLNPFEILLVVDAMSGQQAVNVAKEFNDKLRITGALMSKLDSDARGGAALSIAYLTGIHIKFSGVGERIRDIEVFNPAQMANRILGMGDIVKLVETVQEEIDEKEARKLVNRMMSGNFDLNDMLRQIESTRKLGPLGALAKLIPGMPKISSEDAEKAEAKIKKTRCIIQSMTIKERKNPDILKAERKIRIANGSGMQVSDVNTVLKQYDNMKLQMKQFKSMFGGRFPFMR